MAKHHSKRERPAGDAPKRNEGRRTRSTSDVLGYHWACGKCLKNPFEGFSHRRFPTDLAAMAAGKLHKQRHHNNPQDVLIMVAPETRTSAFKNPLGNGPFTGSCGGCTFTTEATGDYNEADDLAAEHRRATHPDDPDVKTNVTTAA